MNVFTEDRQSAHAIAFYKFISLADHLDIAVKMALKPFGLTQEQLNVLYVLAKQWPEKLHANDIKTHLIVSNPDVTRMIDRLVNKKLVRRETCAENRRMVDIQITDEGRVVFEQAHYAAKAAAREFLSADISKDEAIQLYSILKKIKL